MGKPNRRPGQVETKCHQVRSRSMGSSGSEAPTSGVLLCMERSTPWRDTAWAMSHENVEQHDLPLEEYHRAGREITNGNPEVYKALYSRRDDVTLANPFGPPVRGWSEVSARLDRAAQVYRDGRSSDSRTCRRLLPRTSPAPSRSRVTGHGSAARRSSLPCHFGLAPSFGARTASGRWYIARRPDHCEASAESVIRTD